MSRTHFSTGITAFIDILGFSERIVTAKTNDDIERMVADINRFKGHSISSQRTGT